MLKRKSTVDEVQAASMKSELRIQTTELSREQIEKLSVFTANWTETLCARRGIKLKCGSTEVQSMRIPLKAGAVCKIDSRIEKRAQSSKSNIEDGDLGAEQKI
jgi:hypothetical protein